MTAAPPRIYTHSDLTLGHDTHVWTDEPGVTHGTARFGGVDITFRAAAQVREVIAYLALLAQEMDDEAARQDESPGEDGDEEPVPYWPALGLGGAR